MIGKEQLPTSVLRCPCRVSETDKPCKTVLGTFVPGVRGQELTTLPNIRVTTRPDGVFFHCPSCGGGYVWFIGPRIGGNHLRRTVGSITGVAQYEVKKK